jgi:hypothetical protein
LDYEHGFGSDGIAPINSNIINSGVRYNFWLLNRHQTPRDQSLYHRHRMQTRSVAIVERTKSASHMLLYVLEVCRTPVAGFMRAHSTVTLNASFLDAGVHFDRQIDRNDLPWTAFASRLTGGASGHATSFRR